MNFNNIILATALGLQNSAQFRDEPRVKKTIWIGYIYITLSKSVYTLIQRSLNFTKFWISIVTILSTGIDSKAWNIGS